MNRDKIRLLRRIVLSVSVVLVAFMVADALFPLDTKRLYKPKSTEVFDRNGRRLRITLSEDGFLRIPMPPGKIRSDVADTLLAYEDRWFYYHPGFNIFSIFRAAWFNLTHSRRLGASTLTMQLARMMHKKPRTLMNKAAELFMALQIEYHQLLVTHLHQL